MTDTQEAIDDVLKHFGTKGMKWGVRKDRGHEGEKATTKKISKLDKKYERSLVGLGGYVKMNNAVANRINPRLDVLNAKPQYQGDMTKNPKVHKQYLNEYKKELQKSCEEAMGDIGSNASGTRRVTLKAVGEGLDTTWEASMEDLKHAENANVRITPYFDKNGKITGQTLEPIDTMQQGESLVKDFLKHYGVKGMRWGVRNDGSVSSTTKTTSKRKKPATDVTVTQKPGGFARSKGGKRQTAAEDAVRVQAARQLAKKSTTDALSTKQLQEAVNRMNLEQQYSSLSKKADRRSKGRKFVEMLLSKENVTLAKDVVKEANKKK